MSKLLLEQSGGIATITLNRPKLGNAIDMELARSLRSAAQKCVADPSVRCVVLTGAGGMFCVGGDIGAFADAGDDAGGFLQELADELHGAIEALAMMSKPLVTRINGPAAGAGMSLAMLGDIAIASETTHFTAAYTAIGLTPDGGMTWLLPRLIGLRSAQKMLLTNQRMRAPEAARVGLVSDCVAEALLDSVVADAAEALAVGPVSAIGSTRRLLLDAPTRSLAEHLKAEAASIAAAAATADAREGVDAFLARRRPEFGQ